MKRCDVQRPRRTHPNGREPSAYRRSILALHGAVMLFGLSAVLGRWIAVPAVWIAGGRVLCSAAALFAYALIRRSPLRLNSIRDYGMALGAGVVLAVHWTTFFLSIQEASVAVGTITFSAFPLFLTVLEPMVFREPVRGRSALWACVLLLGVGITIPEFSLENPMTMGVLWGLISSLSYGVLSLFNRYLSGQYSANVVCLYEQATAAVALLPCFFLVDGHWTAQDLAAVGVLGFVCTAFAHSLYVAAQKRVKAQTAGIISGMETVYAVVYAMILLGEMPSGREWLGGAAILCAALANSVMGEAEKEGIST